MLSSPKPPLRTGLNSDSERGGVKSPKKPLKIEVPRKPRLRLGLVSRPKEKETSDIPPLCRKYQRKRGEKLPKLTDSKLSMEQRLNIKLRGLQQKVRRGYELEKVVWLPGKKVLNPEGKPLDGEVKGNVIYIYTENDPVFILKHEFWEYLLTQDKKPLMNLVSKLLSHIMYNQYRSSEELADTLAKLL